MPDWVAAGVQDYARRLPREFNFELVEIAPGKRGKGMDPQRAMAAEGQAMLAAVAAGEQVVALEVAGRPWSTEQLAGRIADWQMQGHTVNLLVGGPDGLADECRQRADQLWSLSALTLPHPLVRVLLVEQLYRAWTINSHHPYHK